MPNERNMRTHLYLIIFLTLSADHVLAASLNLGKCGDEQRALFKQLDFVDGSIKSNGQTLPLNSDISFTAFEKIPTDERLEKIVELQSEDQTFDAGLRKNQLNAGAVAKRRFRKKASLLKKEVVIDIYVDSNQKPTAFIVIDDLLNASSKRVVNLNSTSCAITQIDYRGFRDQRPKSSDYLENLFSLDQNSCPALTKKEYTAPKKSLDFVGLTSKLRDFRFNPDLAEDKAFELWCKSQAGKKTHDPSINPHYRYGMVCMCRDGNKIVFGNLYSYNSLTTGAVKDCAGKVIGVEVEHINKGIQTFLTTRALRDKSFETDMAFPHFDSPAVKKMRTACNENKHLFESVFSKQLKNTLQTNPHQDGKDNAIDKAEAKK